MPKVFTQLFVKRKIAQVAKFDQLLADSLGRSWLKDSGYRAEDFKQVS
jgi:hypothetical protein